MSSAHLRLMQLALVAWLSTPLTLRAGVTVAEERVDHQTQAAMALDAHPARGAEDYAQNCARCHGSDGRGNAEKLIPALAGQRFAYLVRQLANFAGSERDSATMHSVVSQPGVDDPQRWVDIAAHLNRLAPATEVQVGNGEAKDLGRGIFHEQCASCHGADAGGDKEGFVPSLRHQHFGYLDKQMHNMASGYRHNVDEELVLFLRSFDERDMRGTADYLSRLQGAGKMHKTMRQDGVVVN
jgi:cytochrome c553